MPSRIIYSHRLPQEGILRLLSSPGFLVQARSRLQNAIADRKRVGDVLEAIPQRISREEDPKHVEENQVHPEEHEVAAVEILVAGEPLGSESHETCGTLVSYCSIYANTNGAGGTNRHITRP